jgi:hypothetical protein
MSGEGASRVQVLPGLNVRFGNRSITFSSKWPILTALMCGLLGRPLTPGGTKLATWQLGRRSSRLAVEESVAQDLWHGRSTVAGQHLALTQAADLGPPGA